MAFPNIFDFPHSSPGPYERQMGAYIVEMLLVFVGRVPDADSHAHVGELADNPSQWSAGHAMFDEVRSRCLAANDAHDRARSAQYCLEEACCQAMYNATTPDDPFDPSSAFFVVAQALALARCLNVPLDDLADVFSTKG